MEDGRAKPTGKTNGLDQSRVVYRFFSGRVRRGKLDHNTLPAQGKRGERESAEVGLGLWFDGETSWSNERCGMWLMIIRRELEGKLHSCLKEAFPKAVCIRERSLSKERIRLDSFDLTSQEPSKAGHVIGLGYENQVVGTKFTFKWHIRARGFGRSRVHEPIQVIGEME